MGNDQTNRNCYSKDVVGYKLSFDDKGDYIRIPIYADVEKECNFNPYNPSEDKTKDSQKLRYKLQFDEKGNYTRVPMWK